MIPVDDGERVTEDESEEYEDDPVLLDDEVPEDERREDELLLLFRLRRRFLFLLSRWFRFGAFWDDESLGLRSFAPPFW